MTKIDGAPEDLAYSDETRHLIIDKYKDILLGLTYSSRELLKHIRNTEGEVTKKELSSALFATVAGAFVIGFKKGNDMFIDEAEEEELTKKK